MNGIVVKSEAETEEYYESKCCGTRQRAGYKYVVMVGT